MQFDGVLLSFIGLYLVLLGFYGVRVGFVELGFSLIEFSFGTATFFGDEAAHAATFGLRDAHARRSVIFQERGVATPPRRPPPPPASSLRPSSLEFRPSRSFYLVLPSFNCALLG